MERVRKAIRIVRFFQSQSIFAIVELQEGTGASFTLHPIHGPQISILVGNQQHPADWRFNSINEQGKSHGPWVSFVLDVLILSAKPTAE
jgi:hypothetical protein